LSFKNSFKRFIGIKTEEDLKRPKTPKEKFREFIESLFFAGIAAFFIITFIIQNTRIPTGSMEDTILVGDFVLVNKFIFGATSPRYIPFTQIAIPYFTLPALRSPHRKDIVVFEFPGMRDQIFADDRGVNYVKRCIGLPGDTVQVIDKVVYVNHQQLWIPPHIKYLEAFAKPKDMIEPRIFPKDMPWNEDNYGPIIVPKRGYTIDLNVNNVEQWATTIDRAYGEKVVEVANGVVTIKGKPVKSYTFDQDYYFMMGDNRDDSLDSRFWGYVPRSAVVGEAFITLFSWDRDIPFSDFIRLLGSIRPDRILLLLN
jgi:signal peptidase I